MYAKCLSPPPSRLPCALGCRFTRRERRGGRPRHSDHTKRPVSGGCIPGSGAYMPGLAWGGGCSVRGSIASRPRLANLASTSWTLPARVLRTEPDASPDMVAGGVIDCGRGSTTLLHACTSRARLQHANNYTPCRTNQIPTTLRSGAPGRQDSSRAVEAS